MSICRHFILTGFEIKNNGDLDTYITNLVDYLPKGLEFNEKLNSGWYKSESGNLNNLSLINTKIGPGDSKKLKLALNLDITDDTLGSYINKTEILETTNNKKIIEILITIKTGKIVLYLTLILLIIVISVVMIYLIKKKKINLKKLYK